MDITNMDTDAYIYSHDTLISIHTGKPISSTDKTKPPTFWCDLCQVKMDSPVDARQHLAGRGHEARLKENNPMNLNNSKRKLEVDHESNGFTIKEPVKKRNKRKRVVGEGIIPPDQYIYSPETLISPATGRPFSDSITASPPTFWCEHCHLKLAGPIVARTHLSSRAHSMRLEILRNGFGSTYAY